VFLVDWQGMMREVGELISEMEKKFGVAQRKLFKALWIKFL
jgi:hypothetical protein